MENKFKGTKGKWSFEENGASIIDSNGKTVISTHGVGYCNYEPEINIYKANALLISKAPEMLEMLQYLLDNNMMSVKGDEMVEQLIKEATEI